jgi:hypothetical protein
MSRFIATVVEYRTSSICGSSSSMLCPICSAPSVSTSRKPTDRSYGVVGAFAVIRLSSQVRTRSVNVPPTSMSIAFMMR